jgi:hypothetical protein
MLADVPRQWLLARMHARKRIVATLLLGLLVTVPALIWHRIPARDSANYALLTDEFAHGNLTRAFHPSLPPLLTTLGGALAFFLPDPFLANQMVAILLFLLGVPGTYLLAKELRGERVALIAAVLYAVCPYTVDLAASGGVDAGKLGLLPWLTWATLRWNRHEGALWGMLVGGLGALLALARGEGIFFALAAVLWHLGYLIRQGRFGPGDTRDRLAGLAGATVTLVLILTPWLLYEHSQTGLWVTHTTQFSIYARFGIQDHWPRETIIDDNAVLNPALAGSIAAEPAVAETPPAEGGAPAPSKPSPLLAELAASEAIHSEDADLRDIRKGIRWSKNLEKAAKGAYIPYLVLAVAGAIKRRRDEPAPLMSDYSPLILVALNLAIFLPTNIMAPRYMSAVIPLYLHFAALGVLAVEQGLRRWRFLSTERLRYVTAAALAILALLSQKQLDAFMDARKHEQQTTLMHVGDWIRQHGKAVPTYGTLPNLSVYHNGRSPILLESDGRLRYYARTDGICLYPFYRFTPEQIAAICRQGKVSLVFYDERMEALCPGFSQYWPHDPAFTAVDEQPGFPNLPGKGRCRLLAFSPERTAPR